MRIFKLKRRLQDRELVLHTCRWRDLPALRASFARHGLPETGAALHPEEFGSLLSFWRWVRTTFPILYVLETTAPLQREVIGIVGFYRLDLGRSLWLSITLFDPVNHRQGYGRRAVQALFEAFRERGIAKTVFAEVEKTNNHSLHFLRNLGFEAYDETPTIRLLKRPL